jgi:hypothetical protein
VPTIHPTGWRELEVTGQAIREIETLRLFAEHLPAALTVFHGVHWTRIDRGFSVVGEIDFVVVGPSGRVLLIEQKSGFLAEGPDGLLKTYQGKEKSVAAQLKRTLETLAQRLAPLLQGQPLRLDYLLYCPDYRLRSPATAGLPPERIVDAAQRDTLCRRVAAAFPDEPASEALAQRLRRFFSDELQLAPDVSALAGRAEQLVTRISGGLATWARQLEFEPFRLRVEGTAGCGKTQLALAVLNDAAAAGRRALYVCYNRPLADRIAQIAPKDVEVANFHQWCERRLRAAGEAVDFRQPGVFDAMAARVAALPVRADERVDELVIDEGQDFEQAWVGPLFARLDDRGRAWWLEDPMQNLYGRPPVELPGWTVLRAATNFRNPRGIVDYVRKLVGPSSTLEAASPFAEGVEDFLVYRDTRELVEATTRAITLALKAGFRREDIAVVTFSGRERSALRAFDRIGPHTLRRATGRYDLTGGPEWSDGDFLVETVYRFKGQSAPCVVFTEIDFEEFDERVARKLFVGMTRASMCLFPVLSARAVEHLLQRLK